MFAFKKKYFLIIESTKDINLKNKKKANKINIIYRSEKKIENIPELLKFRRICREKRVNFFISNNIKLALQLKADGIYISAYNRDLRLKRFKNFNYKIIGSAHNLKELNIKILQGCSEIFFSRLFKTSYSNKPSFYGIVKYNLIALKLQKAELVPLGGIRLSNLNKLRDIKCKAFAILSEAKKKPAIISRLF